MRSDTRGATSRARVTGRARGVMLAAFAVITFGVLGTLVAVQPTQAAWTDSAEATSGELKAKTFSSQAPTVTCTNSGSGSVILTWTADPQFGYHLSFKSGAILAYEVDFAAGATSQTYTINQGWTLDGMKIGETLYVSLAERVSGSTSDWVSPHTYTVPITTYTLLIYSFFRCP